MELHSFGATLVVVGPLDARSTYEVREELRKLLATPDEAPIVLDCTQVDWIDGAALRMLAVATQTARHSGHHLVLRGCQPGVRRLLHRSHLRGWLELDQTA